MLIYLGWKENVFDNYYAGMLSYLFMTIMTPIILIFDILLSPFEIIALIIYKKYEGR